MLKDAVTRSVSPGPAEAASRAAPIVVFPGRAPAFVLRLLHHRVPGIFAWRGASVPVGVRRWWTA